MAASHSPLGSHTQATVTFVKNPKPPENGINPQGPQCGFHTQTFLDAQNVKKLPEKWRVTGFTMGLYGFTKTVG